MVITLPIFEQQPVFLTCKKINTTSAAANSAGGGGDKGHNI